MIYKELIILMKSKLNNINSSVDLLLGLTSRAEARDEANDGGDTA
jgi:hypothetical protein